MVHKARHDYIELSYVYGGAVATVVLLSLIAMPMDMSRFGFVVPPPAHEKKSLYATSAFDGIEVRAKAYIVYDLVAGEEIASKNADEMLPLASVTKVMTAVTALAHNDSQTPITITQTSIEDGYDLGLKKNQKWNLDELLKYTLVFSSNDGAHAIADGLGGRESFVSQMNTDSTALGLQLIFTDPAGLDVGNMLGGSGTARDVAKLFGIARTRFPAIFEATTKTRLNVLAGKERITGIPNTNQEVNTLFGAEASKTGYTDIAGGNLGVIVDIALGHPVVIVVLGSTREERFTDMNTLYEALLQSLP
ncbi:MAG: D-alanyl-D-alanine carboxypeptidase family protein [Candidatus Paceibacterota bacterium]